MRLRDIVFGSLLVGVSLAAPPKHKLRGPGDDDALSCFKQFANKDATNVNYVSDYGHFSHASCAALCFALPYCRGYALYQPDLQDERMECATLQSSKLLGWTELDAAHLLDVRGKTVGVRIENDKCFPHLAEAKQRAAKDGQAGGDEPPKPDADDNDPPKDRPDTPAPGARVKCYSVFEGRGITEKSALTLVAEPQETTLEGCTAACNKDDNCRAVAFAPEIGAKCIKYSSEGTNTWWPFDQFDFAPMVGRTLAVRLETTECFPTLEQAKANSIKKDDPMPPKKDDPTGPIKKDKKPLPRGLTDFEQRIAENIVDDVGSVTFDDIIGLKGVKKALFANVILPQLKPELFDEKLRAPTKGVLLFGPPGNGKTFMAKALAHKADATFISLSASSIGSKWLGDSENLMRAVFTLARKMQPCIVFVDEVDSLLSGRSSGQSDVNRKVVNEFLQGLEGVGSQPGDRVLVLAATNRPMDIDSAALRRFKGKYYIGLPGDQARINIIKKLLAKHPAPNAISEADYAAIAKQSENYSASDLTNVMKFAAKMPIRDVKDMDKLAKMKPKDLRPLVLDDILAGLKNVRASSSQALIKELLDWNNKHGNTKPDDQE